MEKIIKKIKDGSIFLNTKKHGVNAIVNLGDTDKIKIYNTLEADAHIQTSLIKKAFEVVEGPHIEVIKDRKDLTIKQEKTTLKLEYQESSQTITEFKPDHKITVSMDDIKKMIELKKDIKPDNDAIKYIYISSVGIAATDTYRLGVYKSDIKINDNIDFMVPYAVVELLELVKNQITINKKDHDYIAELGADIKISWKNFYTQFPDVKNIIKIKDAFDRTLKINKKDLEKALKKAIKISVDDPEGKNATTWTIKKDNIEIYGKNEKMNITQELKAEATHDLKIALNGSYILDYLKRIKDETITINYMTSSQMIIFDNNNYNYYCMPLALRD